MQQTGSAAGVSQLGNIGRRYLPESFCLELQVAQDHIKDNLASQATCDRTKCHPALLLQLTGCQYDCSLAAAAAAGDRLSKLNLVPYAAASTCNSPALHYDALGRQLLKQQPWHT